MILSVTLLLVVSGCATKRPASYSELKSPEQVPASDQASPEDVKLGEEIRQTLLKDKKLAPPPSNVIATVQDGVVTLRGSVPSRDNKQEMYDKIMQLPGVARVDDELEIRRNRYSGW